MASKIFELVLITPLSFDHDQTDKVTMGGKVTLVISSADNRLANR